jgi:hypothetical protein
MMDRTREDAPSVGTSVFTRLDAKHDVSVSKDGRDRVRYATCE